jgi:hypothetical protein
MSHFAFRKYRKNDTHTIDALLASAPVELLTTQQQSLEATGSASQWDTFAAQTTNTIVTLRAKTGSASLELQRVGGTNAFLVAASDFTAMPAAAPGDTIKTTAWAYRDNSTYGGVATVFYIRTSFYTSGNSFISHGTNDGSPITMTDDDWTYYEQTTIAPATTAKCRAEVNIVTYDSSPVAFGYKTWIDDLHMIKM